MISPEQRDDLIRRLRRIEGQTQGIQRMLEEDRDCKEVLNQLASVRAATRSVSVELARQYALTCLSSPDCSSSGDDVDTVVDFLLHLPS